MLKMMKLIKLIKGAEALVVVQASLNPVPFNVWPVSSTQSNKINFIWIIYLNSAWPIPSGTWQTKIANERLLFSLCLSKFSVPKHTQKRLFSLRRIPIFLESKTSLKSLCHRGLWINTSLTMCMKQNQVIFHIFLLAKVQFTKLVNF